MGCLFLQFLLTLVTLSSYNEMCYQSPESPVVVSVSPAIEGQVAVKAVLVGTPTEVEEVRTKPFQRLQFLVRDWPNFDADWEDDCHESHLKTSDIEIDLENEDDEMVMVGPSDSKSSGDGKDAVFAKLRAEMRTYLKDVIKDRGLSDLQSTREQISRCFGTVDCFLLPHPGLHVEKKNFSGSIPQIGSFFRGMVNRSVPFMCLTCHFTAILLW